MTWKTKILIPISKSLGFTLIIFAALLCLCAVIAAHSIWIQGHHDSKFGNEWGNFQFIMTIFSMILGVQCGILLLGNATSAILMTKAFTRIPIIIGVAFTVANAILIALKVDPTGTFFLFGLPGACASMSIIGTAIEKRRHPTRKCRVFSRSREKL